MTSYSRNTRAKKQGSPAQVNLVSARSRSNVEANRLSRRNAALGYTQLRKKRVRRKRIFMGVSITLVSLFIAALAGVSAFAFILNGKLGIDLEGNKHDFNTSDYDNVFTAPMEEEDPFWVLLMGTDAEDDGVPRTDTLILVRVDQKNGIAMVSIPRDTYVNIPGYGHDKINAAYSLGELEKPGTGVALTVKTVSEFADVDISYFAQINFNGLVNLVDGLGGVEVDVPVDIIGDRDAGSVDIYYGLQTLNGEEALVFCRSRDFGTGDYQRQANQRTFLQALAKQVLAADPITIATTVTNIAEMTFTNMDITKLVKVAQSMRGMKENAIHTYHVPSTTAEMANSQGDIISYVIADSGAWAELIYDIDCGDYPPPQDDPFAGVVPDSYVASSSVSDDMLAGQVSSVVTKDYTIDVRNGYGIQGSATAVSDMLSLAGYVPGEIGNTNAYLYEKTLIIYKDSKYVPVAQDIKERLGYGRIIASNGNYQFNGDILIVVGGDFR